MIGDDGKCMTALLNLKSEVTDKTLSVEIAALANNDN